MQTEKRTQSPSVNCNPEAVNHANRADLASAGPSSAGPTKQACPVEPGRGGDLFSIVLEPSVTEVLQNMESEKTNPNREPNLVMPPGSECGSNREPAGHLEVSMFNKSPHEKTNPNAPFFPPSCEVWRHKGQVCKNTDDIFSEDPAGRPNPSPGNVPGSSPIHHSPEGAAQQYMPYAIPSPHHGADHRLWTGMELTQTQRSTK